MGIDPAPFWGNFFLNFFESKYIQQLIYFVPQKLTGMMILINLKVIFVH